MTAIDTLFCHFICFSLSSIYIFNSLYFKYSVALEYGNMKIKEFI